MSKIYERFVAKNSKGELILETLSPSDEGVKTSVREMACFQHLSIDESWQKIKAAKWTIVKVQVTEIE